MRIALIVLVVLLLLLLPEEFWPVGFLARALGEDEHDCLSSVSSSNAQANPSCFPTSGVGAPIAGSVFVQA